MALDDPSRAHLHQQISRPASAASHMAGSTAHDPRLSQVGAGRQMKPYQIAERVGGQVAKNDTLLGGPPSPKLAQASLAGTVPTGGYVPNGRPGPAGLNTYPSTDGRAPAVNEFGQPGQPGGGPEPPRTMDAPGAMPPPAFSSPPTTTSMGRFAVVNATQRDELDSPRSSRIHEPQLTAAEEKQRLREQMNDTNSYASVPPPGVPPPSVVQPQLNGIKSPGLNQGNTGGTSSSLQNGTGKNKWETAEQEKQRLFESARAAAHLTQRRAVNTSASGGGSGSSPKAKQVSASASDMVDGMLILFSVC